MKLIGPGRSPLEVVMRGARLVAVCLAGSLGLFMGAACSTSALTAHTMQPNPLTMPSNEVLRESKHLHIAVKDMDIPRAFRMYQSAWFQVVSRDRLRFHVVLVHKWEEMTDVRGWNAHLEDDSGHVYYPEAREKRTDKHTGQVWDYERRSAEYNLFGDVIGTRNDGYKQRVPLDKVDLFKGSGDVVFHAPDLFHEHVKRLTLVLERGGVAYRFTWDLYDPREDGYREEEGGDNANADPGEPIKTRGIESVGGYAYPH
jgi:hypothetical protein